MSFHLQASHTRASISFLFISSSRQKRVKRSENIYATSSGERRIRAFSRAKFKFNRFAYTLMHAAAVRRGKVSLLEGTWRSQKTHNFAFLELKGEIRLLPDSASFQASSASLLRFPLALWKVANLHHCARSSGMIRYDKTEQVVVFEPLLASSRLVSAPIFQAF